ncbi:MAG TPA: nitroreductase family deazaflavin-dependent oxidoreductase [Candidatus Limnocylindrales bacterium]|jgi:deazaflavin-dependent oxidoreductase (nitroreductase family)
MRVPRVALRLLWAYHRLLDRVTGGRFDTSRYGGPTLWLTTVGRRSGRRRENALTYIEHDPNLVVVASNAGHADDPAWWLNLRSAPDTTIRLAGQPPRAIHAREAKGAERADLWARFVRRYPQYGDYEHQTRRRIAVIVLEPRNVT